MTPASNILISLSSFGAGEVRRHGQLWFTHLCKEAGADGIEVRGELLTEPAVELPSIAAAARELAMDVVYSSPEALWSADGEFELAALERGLHAAEVLGALRFKMSIGGFGKHARPSLPELKERLHRAGVELVIENDQTATAGTVDALEDFYAAVDEQRFALGMTFDMGNWSWVGECALQAAERFAQRVCYVHCKGVQRQPQRWAAVPLAESSAAWRSILRTLSNTRWWGTT
jgi:sugar phosphate isomerase/epimerase